MANPERKMATIRRVSDVTPIEGADRIEAVHIDGWVVVAKKGEFLPGDLCVYLEIDTFCPTAVEPLAFLSERGTKVMGFDGVEARGHVLKTARLRGVWSQGLCLSPGEFGISDEEAQRLCDDEEDISERIGVCEYVRPLKTGGGTPKFIKNPYDPSVAPVTSAERVQNCTRIWDALKKVEAYCTVKVDGRSTTLVYDPRRNSLRLFSHHRELDYEYQPEDGGKTIAQISYEAAERQGLVGFCERNPGLAVQFELTGPGIQRSATSEYRCHVFAVWSMETMEKADWWTLQAIYSSPDARDHKGWSDVCKSHVKAVCWDLDDFDTPQDLLDAVDSLRGNVAGGRKDAPDEGVVFHVFGQGDATDEEWAAIRNKLGPNMEVKAVSNKYLLKSK